MRSGVHALPYTFTMFFQKNIAAQHITGLPAAHLSAIPTSRLNYQHELIHSVVTGR
jgi:hypothetical protein